MLLCPHFCVKIVSVLGFFLLLTFCLNSVHFVIRVMIVSASFFSKGYTANQHALHEFYGLDTCVLFFLFFSIFVDALKQKKKEEIRLYVIRHS